MNKVYIVRASGIYWKDISYVASNKTSAISKCIELAESDVDDYHKWEVTEHTIGEVNNMLHDCSGNLENNPAVIFSTNKEEATK